MRGIAAFLVVGFHVANSFGVADEPTTLRHFAGRLDLGVWVFFVISGFLLHRPFVVSRLQGEPGTRLRSYAWRRFLRIFPAYWVALTVITIWLDMPGVFTWGHGPQLYLLVQNYSTSTFGVGLGQAWSLCVELAFYAFLPLLWLALAGFARARGGRSTVRAEALAVILVAIGSIVFRWVCLSHPYPRGGAYMPWYLDGFAAGMLLAVLSAASDLSARRSRVVALIERFPALPWAAALIALVVVAEGIGLNGDYRQAETVGQEMEKTLLYAAVAIGLIIPAVWGNPDQGLIRRFLASRPLQFTGRVSYGVFLYQGVVISQLLIWGARDITVPHFSYVLWYGMVFGGSLALATVSWYLIESPALKLKRLVPGRRVKPQSAPALDAAAAAIVEAAAPVAVRDG